MTHSLAPDHWMPFMMVGRAQKWNTSRTIFTTFLAGFGHVSGSVVLGLIGLITGQQFFKLLGKEPQVLPVTS